MIPPTLAKRLTKALARTLNDECTDRVRYIYEQRLVGRYATDIAEEMGVSKQYVQSCEYRADLCVQRSMNKVLMRWIEESYTAEREEVEMTNEEYVLDLMGAVGTKSAQDDARLNLLPFGSREGAVQQLIHLGSATSTYVNASRRRSAHGQSFTQPQADAIAHQAALNVIKRESDQGKA